MSRPVVRLFYAAANAGGLTSIVNRRWKSQRVVSYHNVLPDELARLAPDDGSTVSASTFERQLVEIARHLPFTTEVGKERTALVTFDDGNKNNFECAVPILERLGIKAYFFVPLEVPGSGKPAWVDLIRLWCDWADAGTAFPGGIPGSLLTGDLPARRAARIALTEACFADVRVRLAMSNDIERWRDEHGRGSIPSEYLRLRYEPMDPDHLRQLRELGHKVGSHSVRHDRLSTLPSESLEEDFRRSKAEVGRTYNTDVYCYPFGGADEVNAQVVDACSRAGFSCAFINCETVGFDAGRYTLPRFTLEEHDDPLIVRTRVSGLDSFLKKVVGRRV